MYCEKCKKDRDVHGLFNGEFRCTKCKSVIVFKDFRIDAVNTEQFELSEIIFHECLEGISRRRESEEAASKKLRKAIELCRQSALNGNPKALLRLAYYYEINYVGLDAAVAFKVACNYYEKIWRNAFTDATVNDLGERLRPIAAARHLSLLRNLPGSLKVSGGSYSYDTKLQSMRALGIECAPDGRTAPDPGDAERVNRILDLALEGGRSPIFGLLYMSGADFSEWAAREIRHGKKKLPCLRRYANANDLTLFLIGGSGAVWLKDTFNFNGVKADEGYYLCFVCTKNHRFNGSKRYLESKNGQFALLQLRGKAAQTQEDYVFYPDDVLAFLNHRFESVAHATKDLMEYALRLPV